MVPLQGKAGNQVAANPPALTCILSRCKFWNGPDPFNHRVVVRLLLVATLFAS